MRRQLSAGRLPNRVSAGVSLVELMIALALGSFLMAGFLQIFMANQRSTLLVENFAQVQESGRLGVEMLLKEIRMADYHGCVTGVAAIRNHLDKGDPDYHADTMDFLSAGVAGHNNVNTLKIGTKSVLKGTDTLTLRGATDACSGRGRVRPPDYANALLVSAGCNLEVGEVLLLSHCDGGELFTVSDRSTKTLSVEHAAGKLSQAGAVDNLAHSFSRTYGPESQLLRPYQNTFFIAEGAKGPALFVNANGSSLELITSATDLQLDYGEDTDADHSVDRYVAADKVADMAQVKAIRVKLSVIEGQVSKQYTAVANIRNRR